MNLFLIILLVYFFFLSGNKELDTKAVWRLVDGVPVINFAVVSPLKSDIGGSFLIENTKKTLFSSFRVRLTPGITTFAVNAPAQLLAEAIQQQGRVTIKCFFVADNGQKYDAGTHTLNPF